MDNSILNALEAQMDTAFTNAFLLPNQEKLVGFFTELLSAKHDYRNDTRTQDIKVIDLSYSASDPLRFLFAEPCRVYYSSDKTVNIAELHLADYDIFDIEELGTAILDANHFDYSGMLENDMLDLAFFWENRFDLERAFIVDCWKKAKAKTLSEILGFLEASDSPGGIYDLDNDHCLDDIETYLKQKGFSIAKEVG